MPSLSLANEYGQPVGVPLPGWSPRPVPGSEALHGRFVDVVPFEDAHLPGLFAATCGPQDAHLWTYMAAGPFWSVAQLGEYVGAMQRAPDVVPYALVVRGEVLGIATFLRIAPALGSLEVGSITFGRRLQRTAAATEAMYLMAQNAFRLGYRRYEWKCDSLNEPSRRAARRLGFSYEGRFRQAVVYKGRNRDTDWFAMTDRDWERLSGVFERWLADVDDTGQQRSSLSVLTTNELEGLAYRGRHLRL